MDALHSLLLNAGLIPDADSEGMGLLANALTTGNLHEAHAIVSGHPHFHPAMASAATAVAGLTLVLTVLCVVGCVLSDDRDERATHTKSH